MKKTIFTMALVVGLSALTMAQEKAAFKITAGITNSMVKTEVDNEKDNSKSRIGFTAGVGSILPLGKHFSFEPSLNFTQKGGKDKQDQAAMNVVLNYLELPMNLVYHSSGSAGKFFIGAGPSLSYGLSGKVKVEESGASASYKLKFGSGDEDDLKSMDMGANFVTGYQFKGGISINANYNLGLSNIISGNQGGSWKNNYLGIRLGYTIGKKS